MRKTKSQHGFTLIEMLIVVAIIAILVAVSIPLVSSSLEKARVTTDRANERAAKAELIIRYLAETDTATFAGKTYVYDAANGSIQEAAASIPATVYGKCSTHKDKVIYLNISTDGKVTGKWNAKGQTSIDTSAVNCHDLPAS